ncbi:MAG TPA: outer membrane protein assembly factor BamE [Chthoniobacterales bacterium]|nr:outer membrane protein assembly factor BamE [Chthoniobacterales bacterium]
MKEITSRSTALFALLILFTFVGCNRSVLSGSLLTPANYDQITVGMSKAQVEKILGPPTTVESKDMIIFKKTIYKYEDGKKFAMITFKNDQVDEKTTNLGREP